ncbi:MAG: orotidine-5'-phosphate decarboxylase [Candidatus Heimdallarchaeota archaeon]
MHFIERLIELIHDKHSVVCMGLDPRMEKEGEIPNYLIKQYENPNTIILEFNKTLIEANHDLIPLIKPQMAFYEKYEALNALKETINFAHKNDLLVILDSKRNDIGTTSKAYADATFHAYNADACTLNAYLGFDSIKPYLEFYDEKGLFLLVKTSNPSSHEFQDLFSIKLDNINNDEIEVEKDKVKLQRNYVQMAKLVKEWGKNLQNFNQYNNLGVVVGATFPQELKSIREIVNNSFILIPGYGAQGAQVKDIKYGFHLNGMGGIVNSSRAIIYAYNKKTKYPPEKYEKAARDEIIDMNNLINKIIGL